MSEWGAALFVGARAGDLDASAERARPRGRTGVVPTRRRIESCLSGPVFIAVGLAFVAAGCGAATGPQSAPVSSLPLPATSGSPAPPAPPPPEGLGVPTGGWKTDFSRHTVPLSEITSGGPGKDGIPALDAPEFVTVETVVGWLEAHEPVVELTVAGDSRAYPLQILIWHEIVNDTVGGTPVAVTFCPLCNTAIVFDRRLGGRVLDFGTTGNLRNSDLVMYDRQTETWWQQFGGEAIVGALAGERLRLLPARIVAWRDFARDHPGGRVLSRDTGYDRAYGQNPYTGYDDVNSPPFFPAANPDDTSLLPKERVALVERGDEVVVIPFSALSERKRIRFTLAGEELEAVWVPGVRSALDSSDIAAGSKVGSALIRDVATGKTVVYDEPFWFSVAAFRPDARIVRRERLSALELEGGLPRRPSESADADRGPIGRRWRRDWGTRGTESLQGERLCTGSA